MAHSTGEVWQNPPLDLRYVRSKKKMMKIMNNVSAKSLKYIYLLQIVFEQTSRLMQAKGFGTTPKHFPV